MTTNPAKFAHPIAKALHFLQERVADLVETDVRAQAGEDTLADGLEAANAVVVAAAMLANQYAKSMAQYVDELTDSRRA